MSNTVKKSGFTLQALEREPQEGGRVAPAAGRADRCTLARAGNRDVPAGRLARTGAGRLGRLRDYWQDISQSVNVQFGHWFSGYQASSIQAKKIDLPPEAQCLKAELSLHIGQETVVGHWHQVTQEQINQFADVTLDRQWIHTNPDRACLESPFKDTIAHGFLTLSLLPYLTDSVNPDKPLYPQARLVINYGLNLVRFLRPVKVGTRVRARSRLLSVEEVRQGLEVITEITIEMAHSKRPACTVQTILRLYF